MNGLIIGVNSQSAAVVSSTYSLFADTDVPSIQLNDNDGLSGLQLGTYFRSSIAGFVTAIRFYKHSAANANTRTGTLFNAAGTKLGQVVLGSIAGLTTGWNSVNFASPIAITANQDYIICIYQTDSSYPANGGYFATPKVSGVLTAPTTASNGNGNGSYLYFNTANNIPNNTFNSGNYWVDIIFTT